MGYSIDAGTISDGLEARHYDAWSGVPDNSKGKQRQTFKAVWTYVMTLTSDHSTLDELRGTVSFNYNSLEMEDLVSGIYDNYPITVDYSIVITGTLKDGNGVEWTLTSDPFGGQVCYNETDELRLIASPSGWTVSGSEVIPEPTSGLLMLFGMAGLALRRRRA